MAEKPMLGAICAVTYAVPFGATFSTNISSLETAAGWFDPNGLPLDITYAGPTSVNGTNVTTDGTSIYYGGTVVTYDSFSYGIGDGFETGSGTVSLAPFLQLNGSQTLNGSGNPVINGTSPIGAANYTYGVERHIILAHKLIQLYIFRILPPLLPFLCVT